MVKKVWGQGRHEVCSRMTIYICPTFTYVISLHVVFREIAHALGFREIANALRMIH